MGHSLIKDEIPVLGLDVIEPSLVIFFIFRQIRGESVQGRGVPVSL